MIEPSLWGVLCPVLCLFPAIPLYSLLTCGAPAAPAPSATPLHFVFARTAPARGEGRGFSWIDALGKGERDVDRDGNVFRIIHFYQIAKESDFPGPTPCAPSSSPSLGQVSLGICLSPWLQRNLKSGFELLP